MKKYLLDLTVRAVERVHERYVLIRLTDEAPLPPMLPGQFVEVRVDGSPTTFLRRPISINFVDEANNELWLLVATVGDGTRRLALLQAGDRLNCMLPLGNGFSSPDALLNAQNAPQNAADAPQQPAETPQQAADGVAAQQQSSTSVLLVGGGVGVAPLLYQGATLQKAGLRPTFLLGARTKNDLLMLEAFERYGRVLTTTEDGSHGERGFVTNHSVLGQEHFDCIQTCGPTPMMKAVARYAYDRGIACEASLENLMACGLGACLCCVEKVKDEAVHHVCVCQDGPVFNINRLLWQS